MCDDWEHPCPNTGEDEYLSSNRANRPSSSRPSGFTGAQPALVTFSSAFFSLPAMHYVGHPDLNQNKIFISVFCLFLYRNWHCTHSVPVAILNVVQIYPYLSFTAALWGLKKKIMYVFGCTGSYLSHVGSRSLTRGQTLAPCIGTTSEVPLWGF